MVNPQAKATLTQAMISLTWPPLLLVPALYLTHYWETPGEVMVQQACLLGLALLWCGGAAIVVMFHGVVMLFIGIYQAMKNKKGSTETESPPVGSESPEPIGEKRDGLDDAPEAHTTPILINKKRKLGFIHTSRVLTIGIIILLLAAGVFGYAKWIEPASVEEVWIGEAPTTLEIHLDKTPNSDQRGPWAEYIFYSNSDDIEVMSITSQSGENLYWCYATNIPLMVDSEYDECEIRHDIDGREHIGGLGHNIQNSGEYIIQINGTGEVAIYKHTPTGYVESSINLFFGLYALSSLIILIGGWMWARDMNKDVSFLPVEGPTRT